jgi:DNA-binding transcriptional MerR regulator
MKMTKRTFRIGELADHLTLERFVIRFWEKEFGIRSKRSSGGQRYYDEKDLYKFEMIKRLLYDEGFTISGAKKCLKDATKATPLKETKEQNIFASHVTTLEKEENLSSLSSSLPTILCEQIKTLQEHLLRLRELL